MRMLRGGSKGVFTRLSEWFLLIAAVIMISVTVVAYFWLSDSGISFRDLKGSSSGNMLRADR